MVVFINYKIFYRRVKGVHRRVKKSFLQYSAKLSEKLF